MNVMKDFSLEFVDNLPEDIEKKKSESHIAYESSHGIDVNYREFFILIKDNHGQAIAVLTAYTAYSEIYVDDMWVDKPFRHQGYGKTLLQTLEDRFKDKGFNNINLVTNAFQAPEFYKKCGFTMEFVRENKINPKLTKIFFVKYFENKEQTQGILAQ